MLNLTYDGITESHEQLDSNSGESRIGACFEKITMYYYY